MSRHNQRSRRKEEPRMYYLFAWGALALCIIYALQVFFPEITSLFRLQQDVLYSEPWRLVTSIFLHGSFGHLTSNLVGFVLFGLVLESIVGSRRAVGLALFTGVGASLISGHFYSSAVGASGLVFGLIGLLMVLRPLLPVFAFGVPIPMILAGVGWAVANIGGLFIESTTGYIAHLAGLGIGLVLGFLLRDRFGVSRKGGKKEATVMTDREFLAWERRYMR